MGAAGGGDGRGRLAGRLAGRRRGRWAGDGHGARPESSACAPPLAPLPDLRAPTRWQSGHRTPPPHFYTLCVPAPQVERIRGGSTTGGTRACMSEGRRRGRYGTSVWLTAERSFSCCRGRICTKKSSTGINNTRPTQSARPNLPGTRAWRATPMSKIPFAAQIGHAHGKDGNDFPVAPFLLLWHGVVRH